jgi:hypothetical protein
MFTNTNPLDNTVCTHDPTRPSSNKPPIPDPIKGNFNSNKKNNS